MSWTDDPVRDAERHMAKQDAELDKLPRCCECDEPIQTEYCFEVNDKLICPGCMKDNHRKSVENFIER